MSQLPESVAAAVVELLRAVAANPHRLGKPLHFDFEGSWSARRGPYRAIYRIDEEDRRILVMAVGHRSDVYRRR
jgi:mRNA interferase RelE/StbE